MPAELPRGLTIGQVITGAAKLAFDNREIPAPIGGDFPSFDKAYRDLTCEEFAFATSIAQERHKALNWLCGLAPGNRWSATPTDT
ncbi:MAG TPA: hypothetical protein VKW06_02710 [Candidatus Angelobacter sp.]|nr:hypothetical protein [Candidatus Angelobacter sp.]